MSEVAYPSYTERYFTKGYSANLPKGGSFDECSKSSNQNDMQILRHTNRICLVKLAPSHPIIAQNKKIESINFKISDKLDRLSNCVSGKRKRNAQWLNASSPLCRVKCVDDEEPYTIYCGIRGSLIEINENLEKNPQLIASTDTEGYVAIVMPKKQEADVMMSEALMSPDQFDDYKNTLLQSPQR